MSPRSKVGVGLVGVAVAAILGFGNAVGGQTDHTATVHARLPGVSSEILVRATPAAVADPQLALSRVMIAPGAQIPEHEHTGTQIAQIVSGELTYSVFSGEVDLVRYGTDPTADQPDVLGAGDRVVLRAGDALIEHPGSRHQAENSGDDPVLIYLSILYPAGRPPTIYVTPAASPTA